MVTANKKYRYSIDIPNKKLTIITVGNNTWLPDYEEMKYISNWVKENNAVFPNDFAKLQNNTNIDLKLKIYPETKKECVLIIESSRIIKYIDVEDFKLVVNSSFEDANPILFIWGRHKVTRINKNLINML